MRILMVSDVYFPRVNGVSTSIQTLRQALTEAGHSSVLVTPDYPAAAAESGIVRVSGWQIPRDPEDAATTMQRFFASKPSGTCSNTRCGWVAPGSCAKALNSRPGTLATLPYTSA